MILSQRYPPAFNGIVSGDPAMRTGLSNLAIGQWIPVAYNQAAPKDASGKPQIDKFLTDERSQALHGCAHETMRRKGWRSRWHDLRSPRLRLRSRGPACKPGQTDACIASEKISAIKKAFAGPKNAYGTQVYPGFLYDGGIAMKGFVSGLLAMGSSGIFGPYTTRHGNRRRPACAPCLRSARRARLHQSHNLLSWRRQAHLLPRRQRSVVLTARHT